MLKYFYTLLIICSVLLASSYTLAQTPAKSLTANELEIWFDGWLNHEVKQQDLAGIAVSVVQNGQVVFSKGYQQLKKLLQNFTFFMYGGCRLKISTALNPKKNGKTAHFIRTEE